MGQECFLCKKDLGRLSMKFTTKQILDKKSEVPVGMTEKDRVCFNDFTALTNHKAGADYKLKTRIDDYKKDWNKRGIIQFKNERMAILQRVWGSQVEFIAAFDDLTKEGYRLMAHDDNMGAGTGGINSYFYFQKTKYVN